MLFLGATACNQQSDSARKENTKSPQEEQTLPQIMDIEGSYVSDGYENRDEGYDWVGVRIQKTGEDTLLIQVRSRADIKKPTCTLDTEAIRIGEDIYQSSLQGENILFTFTDTTLKIESENPQDDSVLRFYCSGGATVAGVYTKIESDLDPAQVGK